MVDYGKDGRAGCYRAQKNIIQEGGGQTTNLNSYFRLPAGAQGFSINYHLGAS